MSDYPAWLPLRPIQQWPRELTNDRVRSPFTAKWGSTTALLKSELAHLGTRNEPAAALLQIAITDDALRLDGRLRAQAQVAHPGVILEIESRHGHLSYPCDKFTTWRDNLRAIALALESLRRVDRYGITETGQQYSGWKQLGAGTPMPAPTMSEADARKIIAEAAGPDDDLTLRTLHQLHRRAAANTHPDRNGGDRTRWDMVETAADVLRKAGRL